MLKIYNLGTRKVSIFSSHYVTMKRTFGECSEFSEQEDMIQLRLKTMSDLQTITGSYGKSYLQLNKAVSVTNRTAKKII